jgi:hypothetical protein
MIFSTLFGEEVMTKKCIKCGEYKPLCKFKSRSKETKHLMHVERRNECEDCQKIEGKILRDIKKYIPKPPADYKCPICNRAREELNKNGFVCDHDHNTKTFRGWLCDDCNGGLGKFYDDPERLIAAAEYLKNVMVGAEYLKNVMVGAEIMDDKGYELSTHEKQAEFAKKRNYPEWDEWKSIK